MIPYYILIVLPMIPLISKNFKGIRIGKHAAITKNELSISIFFVILLILVSLRADIIGNDTRNYIYYFNLFGNASWKILLDTSIEPGYAILNKLVSCFTSNPNVFFFVVALIYIVPIAILYIDNIESPMLTIALFLTMSTFVMLFSGVRQSIAVALGIIAFYLTKEKKWVPFVLILLLTMTIHRSAFMIGFMYPLYHLKITRKCLLFVVPAMVAVFIFNKPIFSFLALFIYDNYEANIESTGAYTMLILFVLLSVFSYVVADEKKMDSTVLGLRNFLLLATTLQMFAPVHSLAMRMNYYFIIFIPVLIPMIIQASSERWRKVSILAGWIMTIFLIAYFFVSAPVANVLSTFPYRFFWEV